LRAALLLSRRTPALVDESQPGGLAGQGYQVDDRGRAFGIAAAWNR
jgi:hypothetical protein